ncbi:10389_t:CDS:1, partial [Dentiscutata heterogama]
SLRLQNIRTCFAEIMQKCWNTDLLKRPTIEELCEFTNYELINIYKNRNSNNTISISPISNQKNKNKSHPHAYLSSRILSRVIPKSIRISNYVNSQYNLTLSEEISEVQNK